VIAADQTVNGSHKWVALVGNSHANTFQGIPGLAELTGVPGLRVQDVAKEMPELGLRRMSACWGE